MTPAIPTVYAGSTLRDDGRAVGCLVAGRHESTGNGSVAGNTTWLFLRRDGLLHATAHRWLEGRDLCLDPDALGPALGDATGVETLGQLLSRLRGLAAREDWIVDEYSDVTLDALAGMGVPVDPDDLVGSAIDDAARTLEAVRPFVETLDPRALSLCTDWYAPVLTPGAYAALDRTLQPDAPLAAAWVRHPFLKRSLASLWHGDPARFGARVATDMDALVREAVALSSPSLHVNPAVILGVEAALAAMPPDELALLQGQAGRTVPTAVDATVSVGRWMSILPATSLPRGEEEWTACLACFPAVCHALRNAGPGRAVRMLGCQGGWRGLRDRLVRLLGSDLSCLATLLADVGDVATACAEQVLTPATLLAGTDAHATEAEGYAFLFSGRTLPRILEESRDWHARSDDMRERLPSPPTATSAWGAGLPGASYGGVTVTVLTDRDALRAEGATGDDPDGLPGLSHCVGGYAPQCLAGRCRIVSLRATGTDGVTVRLSTAELAHEVTDGDATVRVVQHRGARNSTPPDAARRALDRYVADLASGVLPVDVDALAPMHPDVALEAAAYDWREPGAWEAARDVWAPFLPRWARTATAVQVAACVAEAARRDQPWEARPFLMPSAAA